VPFFHFFLVNFIFCFCFSHFEFCFLIDS
jgi:hypothetical protein